MNPQFPAKMRRVAAGFGVAAVLAWVAVGQMSASAGAGMSPLDPAAAVDATAMMPVPDAPPPPQAPPAIVVVAVPFRGQESLPHPVYSGGTIMLQASASPGGNGESVPIKTAVWDPGDGSAAIPVAGSFEHPANSGSTVVDVISPELRIYRGSSGGLLNAGTDAVQWAHGPCSAPVSSFYATHNALLQGYVRNLPGNVPGALPGSTECVRDTTTAVDYDITFISWGQNDGGSFSYSRPGLTTISSSRNLGVLHTYTGADSQPYTATITVTDMDDNVVTDTFKVQIQPNTTEVQTDMAIDRALWFLHTRLTLDGVMGYWTDTHGDNQPATASAVQAMEIQGHRQTVGQLVDPYANDVARGLRFLFDELRTVGANLQGANNPDSNANGFGLSIGRTTGGSDEGYILGQVIDAFIASGTPNAVTTTGLATNVLGRTYKDVVQDMLDGYAWGATDNYPQGGWEYNFYDNGGYSSSADASASHWWGIGVLAARVWGLDSPAWLIAQNRDIAIPNWQNPSNGVCGYRDTSPLWDSGFNTTPACLIMMNADKIAQTDSRFVLSSGFMATNFDATKGNFYSMYQTAKAMRTAVDGAGVSSPIGLLNGTVDWYAGYRDWLIQNQADDGHWDQSWGSPGIVGSMATGWGVIILSPGLFELGPTAVCTVDSTITCAANATCGAATAGLYANVNFDAGNSAPGDNPLVSYLWDFKDTFTVNTITAQHSFLVTGSYAVQLTVADSKGHTSSATCPITVTDTSLPPVVSTGGPYAICPGGSIVLDGSASFGRGSNILSYSWDWTAPFDFAAPDSIVATPGDKTATFAPPVSPATSVTYNVGLRLTDDTLPANGGPYLPTAFTTVTVRAADDPACNPFPGNPEVTGIWGWGGASGRNTYPNNGDVTTFIYGADGRPYPVSDVSTPGNPALIVTFPDCTQFRIIVGGQLFRIALPPPLAASCTPAGGGPAPVKQDPVITWPPPAAIVAGAALTSVQLNATASVPGIFVYTPPAGTVMNTVGNGQTLQVAFTPTDTTNYNNVGKSVTIDVLGSAPPFNGPTDGGGWAGVIQGGNLIYNGQAYPIVNAVVTFPDCSTYWVAPNGLLFVGAPPAVGCVPSGGAPPSGFQGPPETGVWTGQANQAATLFNYMGVDYAMVNGVVTFPDSSRYAIVAGKYMYKL